MIILLRLADIFFYFKLKGDKAYNNIKSLEETLVNEISKSNLAYNRAENNNDKKKSKAPKKNDALDFFTIEL